MNGSYPYGRYEFPELRQRAVSLESTRSQQTSEIDSVTESLFTSPPNQEMQSPLSPKSVVNLYSFDGEDTESNSRTPGTPCSEDEDVSNSSNENLVSNTSSVVTSENLLASAQVISSAQANASLISVMVTPAGLERVCNICDGGFAGHLMVTLQEPRFPFSIDATVDTMGEKTPNVMTIVELKAKGDRWIMKQLELLEDKPHRSTNDHHQTLKYDQILTELSREKRAQEARQVRKRKIEEPNPLPETRVKKQKKARKHKLEKKTTRDYFTAAPRALKNYDDGLEGWHQFAHISKKQYHCRYDGCNKSVSMDMKEYKCHWSKFHAGATYSADTNMDRMRLAFFGITTFDCQFCKTVVDCERSMLTHIELKHKTQWKQLKADAMPELDTAKVPVSNLLYPKDYLTSPCVGPDGCFTGDRFCDNIACNPLISYTREQLKLHWQENHSPDVIAHYSAPLMRECIRLIRRFLEAHCGTLELWPYCPFGACVEKSVLQGEVHMIQHMFDHHRVALFLLCGWRLLLWRKYQENLNEHLHWGCDYRLDQLGQFYIHGKRDLRLVQKRGHRERVNDGQEAGPSKATAILSSTAGRMLSQGDESFAVGGYPQSFTPAVSIIKDEHHTSSSSSRVVDSSGSSPSFARTAAAAVLVDLKKKDTQSKSDRELLEIIKEMVTKQLNR